MKKDIRFEDYFLFTQHSLSTFDSCPLKFRKRYMEGLKWDSFPDDNIRKGIELGNDFHLMAHRYFSGVPTGAEFLDKNNSPELKGWIESLMLDFPKKPFAQYLSEYKLRMVTPTLKLEANFDLIKIEDNSIEIWDWKTHGGKQSRSKNDTGKRLKEGLQTMVYLFVLKEQIKLVAGREDGWSISMHYWQPENPHVLAEIHYNGAMHEKYRSILERKVDNILAYDFETFEKALYSKHCRYCEFNWYCNNESVDFSLMQEDEDFLDSLDWDSIEERY
ncbi:MAG: PD-(D/E)XK nuclease family protein [Clostridia bacterium]|nr:PD-(D/E)XK nuclease family protein [Clostridia bacterium]